MYFPDIIPKEDREALLKYNGGVIHRVGFGSTPALFIVDMTNGFVLDEYPSGYSRTGIPCAKSIKILANNCRLAKIPVIYTKDSEVTNPASVAERGRWVDKSSSTILPRRNDIYDEIKPQDGDYIVHKAKPSAFFGTQVLSILQFLGVDTLIVTGMVTSGCVRATVVDAFSYNYRVIIPQECVADRSQISHQVSLFDMDTKYADVLKLEEVLRLINDITIKA
ncbi:MAG: isochorismatase family protein [Conexivisphaerales archaeon]